MILMMKNQLMNQRFDGAAMALGETTFSHSPIYRILILLQLRHLLLKCHQETMLLNFRHDERQAVSIHGSFSGRTSSLSGYLQNFMLMLDAVG